MGIREFKKPLPVRGMGETYAYTWDLSPLPAGTYTVPTCRIEDPAGLDVTASLLSGSAAVVGTTFTSPKFIGGFVTQSGRYKLFWSVKIDGEVWSGFGVILFEE